MRPFVIAFIANLLLVVAVPTQSSATVYSAVPVEAGAGISYRVDGTVNGEPTACGRGQSQDDLGTVTDAVVQFEIDGLNLSSGMFSLVHPSVLRTSADMLPIPGVGGGSLSCDVVVTNYSAQFPEVSGVLTNLFQKEIRTTASIRENFSYEAIIGGVVVASGTVSRDVVVDQFDIDFNDSLFPRLLFAVRADTSGRPVPVDTFVGQVDGQNLDLVVSVFVPTKAEFDTGASPEEDGDGDGFPDSVDNCPTLPNPNQEDADLDLLGDVCDPFPNDRDNEKAQCFEDLDRALDDLDMCLAEPPFADADGDGEHDGTDLCPGTANNGTPVDTAGCSLDQFCGSIAIDGRHQRVHCTFADWMNDTLFGPPRDCRVERVSRHGWLCVAW